MAELKLIIGASEINKKIASIKTRGAKLDADIQHVGLSVLAHVRDHSDTTVADKLVHAMPQGSRKHALVEWMLAYGMMSKLDAKADKEAVAAGRLFILNRDKVTDMDEATRNPWTTFKPEADILTAFDAQAAVKGVVARLKKATENHLTINKRTEALAEAKALVAMLTTAE